MARKLPEVDRLTLEFDLFDLPTAQHKAGLAGLILQIRCMTDRPIDEIPIVEVITTQTARVTFTRRSMQALFDELYAGQLERRRSPKPWGDKAVLVGVETTTTVDARTKKETSAKVYVYEVAAPRGPCLARHEPPENPWVRLWKSMIWDIPRGKPTTRTPYLQRANGKPCATGESVWESLVRFVADRRQNRIRVEAVSSATLLAAQACNAEGVPFQGRVDQNFLLHFWQAVVLTYVARTIDHEGKAKLKGFVLAIPEVAELDLFVAEYPLAVAELLKRREEIWGRPRDAVIDVPAQAGLEFLLDLAQSSATTPQVMSSCVTSVEAFHMVKAGNNVKLVSFSRVANRPDLIAEYRSIQTTYKNPLFRAARIDSLVKGERWYANMIRLFARRPWPFFIRSDKTPRFLPAFGKDASALIRSRLRDLRAREGDNVPDDIDRLTDIVNRLIHAYVEGRVKSRTGQSPKDPQFKRSKDGKEYHDPDNNFREAWKRVCSQAFLDMRSRQEQDFVDYFAGTICSVPQFLRFDRTKSRDEYQHLMTILLRRSNPSPTAKPEPCWEDVKALAMVAVSACAFRYQPRSESSAVTSPIKGA